MIATSVRRLLRFIRKAWPCWLSTVLLGAVWIIYSGARTELGANEVLARWSYDIPYRFARQGAVHPARDGRSEQNVAVPEAILIEINDATTANRGYLLQRTNYIELLRRLHSARPKLVFFDLIFVEPSPDIDPELVRAMEEIDRWIVGAASHRIPTDQGQYLPPVELTPGERHARTIKSITPLMQPGHWGYLDLRRDPDGKIRALDAVNFGFDPGHPYSRTAAWRAAVLTGARVVRTPAGHTVPRWLNYYGTPHGEGRHPAFRRHELGKVLEMTPEQCRASFSNAFVFVGIRRDLHPGTAGAPADTFPHPWGNTHCAGMEVQATAVMNLVRDDWLRRVPFSRQLLVVALWGTGIAALLTWSRAPITQFAVLLGAAAVAFASVRVQLRSPGAWWPWLVPVVVQTPWALLTSAWVPAWRARRKLVFISYRSSDGMECARHLQATLDALGVAAFMDKGGVRPGSDYPPVLEKAVRRAPNLLLVLTPAARAILQGQGGGTSRESTVFPDDPGRWIPHEILLARKAGNHIVVALPTTTNRARMVDDSKAAPAEGNPLRTRELPEPLQFLARINPVRFRSDEFHAESVRQLVEALKLPRRTRIHVNRTLREREDLRSEETEAMSPPHDAHTPTLS